MSTLNVLFQIPSVSEDCEQLRKAFLGWGTNAGLIISILAHRNAAQRKLIREQYAETYGEDLLMALDKELSNDFERLVWLWTLEPAERDALLANEATKRWTSSNQVLMENACTRSSNQLFQARQAYHARFKKSLEEDVAYHTKEDFRKLLLPSVSSYRYEGDEVNMTLAKSEAKILHEKISDKAYSDEDLNRILATRSKAQINATLNHYKKAFGNDINKDLKTDPKDEYLALLRETIKCFFFATVKFSIVELLRVTVKCLIRPEKYFEKVLRLASAIVKDTHGDYEKLLLALVGYEDA